MLIGPYKPCTQVFRKLETSPDAEYVKVMNTKAITATGEPCNEDSPDVCEWRVHRKMCCAAGTQCMAGRQLSTGSQPASQTDSQTAAFRQAGRQGRSGHTGGAVACARYCSSSGMHAWWSVWRGAGRVLALAYAALPPLHAKQSSLPLPSCSDSQ